MSHSFSPIKRSPAYQKVYDAIEADILSGRLPKDAVLPTEGELAGQFGVHRSTVREGMRLLEQAGLIRRGAAKRMAVARLEAEETAERASRSLALHGVTFLEVWEALAMFQPEAARLAATRLGEDALDELEVAVAIVGAAEDADGVVAGAVSFFQHVARALDNRAVLVMLQSLNMLIETSLLRVIDVLPGAAARIATAQAEMVAAFRARDGEAAALWMRRHIDDLKRGYEVAGVALNEQVL
ncbi:MAG: GntR family transcriptional regulator [Pseudomonadota bacterium]